MTLSVPPVKSDAGFRKYERQINRCIRGLCRHTKRVVTKKALRVACQDVSYAYGQLADFEKLADEREDVVSGLCRMLVSFSYYCAEDIAEWGGRLSALNARIRKTPEGKAASGKARVLLAGMHISMAKRIIKMMKKSEKGGDILMTGGGALNTGIHKAFEEELMRMCMLQNAHSSIARSERR